MGMLEIRKYLAIVTPSNQLVGIVQVVNSPSPSRGLPPFTIVYNVEKEKYSGAYLNKGIIPETIYLEGGGYVGRKTVAEAIFNERGVSSESLGNDRILQLQGNYASHHPFVGVVFNTPRTDIVSLVGYSHQGQMKEPAAHTILYKPQKQASGPSGSGSSGARLPPRAQDEPSCPPHRLGYIVTFKSRASETAVKSHYQWLQQLSPGIRIRQKYHIGKFRGYAASFDEAIAQRVKRAQVVASVDKDAVLSESKSETQASTSQKRQNQSWAIRSINSPWRLDFNEEAPRKKLKLMPPPKLSRQGAGTWAYIVDSGINIKHQDFGGRAVPGICLANDCEEDRLYHRNHGHWFDAFGHGTHVASIVGGDKYGLAKKTTLIDVRVLNKCAKTTSVTLLSAFQWIADDVEKNKRKRKSVINLSISLSPFPCPPIIQVHAANANLISLPDRTCLGPTFEACRNFGVYALLDLVYEAMFNYGILVIVSAGNQALPAEWDSPRGSKSVLTVGAMNSNWEEAPFSNYGPAVDILAPGVDIQSADWRSSHGERKTSGTSFATPFVTGIALSLLSDESFDSPSQVMKRIKNMAVPDVTVRHRTTLGVGAGMFRRAPTTSRRLYNNPRYGVW
ncbi:hypothetical protein XA68_10313 [Ophiocordyceps unilateralis]|uniref:Peptidase S8/S53 domain-containing protein n=1 Tax=Ophiocordyceps unilateralis TaxID=268505 RepID=A0A2A9PHC9_OPHUN|nr:hypothetical protein XA68_10313 [Ophiocordyceps unilateralis]